MSLRKDIPAVTLDNLKPPYPDFAPGTTAPRPPGAYAYFEHARAHPFRHASKGFDMLNASWLADASALVYGAPSAARKVFARAGLSDLGSFADARRGTECFVYGNADFAVVAFRGTELRLRREGEKVEVDFRHIFLDILTDVQARPVAFGQTGRVHEGFVKAYAAVEERLRECLSRLDDGRRTVWLTGHSLGAAIATLAAARCERLHGLYTFGSPLVGDAAFARALDAALDKRFGIRYYRFMHGQDLVAGVPPDAFGYRHAGTLKLIRRDGQVSDGVGMARGAVNLLGGVFRRAFDIFGRVNPQVVRLIPEQLVDHMPTLYAAHVWNAFVKEAE